MLRLLPVLLLFLMTALPPVSGAPVLPPSAPLDLLPLKKALLPLSSSGPLFSHSTLRMTGTRQGVSATLREDLQVISRRPGHFHASLTQYDIPGGLPKKVVVVSNGASVWIYRPGRRQYSVMSFTAFQQADSDIPTLGLVMGGFYLGDGQPLADAFRSITATNSAEIISALGGLDIVIARQTKSVGGQDDYVYSLTLTKRERVYQFYVNSQTNALARVDLAGSQDGTHLTYREEVFQLTPRPAAPNSQFVFAPPSGVVKAAGVSITPTLRPSVIAVP